MRDAVPPTSKREPRLPGRAAWRWSAALAVVALGAWVGLIVGGGTEGGVSHSVVSTGSVSSSAPTGNDPSGTADCTVHPAPNFTGVPDGWNSLPALPATRARPAVVWTGTQLVAVGGDTDYGGRDHRDTFLLEPATGRWECAGDAPFEAAAEDAVWTGERLLLYGNDRAAAYDPASGTWEQLPPPPPDAPHESFANVWTGDEWIVWGTNSRGAAHGRGVAFDPASGEWRDMAPAPLALDQGNGVWTDSELVVLGADLDGNNHSTTPRAVGAAYDPESDRWRLLPPVDLSPQAVGIARTGDRDVLAYDYESGAALYHPDDDSWEELDPVTVEFGECYPRGVTLDDGSVFLWYCGQAAVFDATTRAFEKVETPITAHWGRPAAGAEVELIAGTLVATGGAVYFVGNAHEGHAGETWRWQPDR